MSRSTSPSSSPTTAQGVLPACLAALAARGVPTIVVDNASRDESADRRRERSWRAVLRNARNEGYGRANNLGVARAPRPTSS